MNEKLEKIRIDTEEDLFSFQSAQDLNGDEKVEYIFTNKVADRITILDNNFEHPVKLDIESDRYAKNPLYLGVKNNESKNYEVCFKTNDIVSFYQYKTDPFYFLKYPLWLIAYLLIAVTFWAIQYLQTIQNKRKLQVEETINSLQMRSIKSQMDPHFMFNVLNGLANNVANGNTDEAYKQIIRFSKLLRSLMSKSDRIDTNLKGELEFVESYLELEKFRFKEDFEYSIKINDQVDMTTRIPKMLIQLLVENGIKHGLRNKLGIKRIDVEIKKIHSKTQVIIEDNGVGRKATQKTKPESGHGLSILQDIIHLNKKLGDKEIQVNYTDMYDEKGKSKGTRVELVF